MIVRAAFFVLLLSSTATAQGLKSYWGPTLGISTPDFGHPDGTYYFGSSYDPFLGQRSPIPSPVIGASAGTTAGKHLAFDAALQYSYTGQSFSGTPLTSRQTYPFSERLYIHKAALPLTIGYAGNIGRTHIRIGVGGSFQYLFTGRVVVSQTYLVNGVPTEMDIKANPFRLNFYHSYPRLQVHPRASLSTTLSRRLMLTAAYSHGKKRIFFNGYFGGLYSSAPRNSAIDLTATYLLRMPQSADKAKENMSGE